MRKIILIFMIGLISYGFTRAEEVTRSTETAKKPELKLLWNKTFDGEIKSFAVFHDGGYVAASINRGRWIWNKEKGKNEYVGTSKIVLLNEYGKELWRREVSKPMGGVKLGNVEPIVVWRGQNEINVYNKKGELMWVRQLIGFSIISPNDKYIATIHTGIEGVTPRGLTVFDIEGNKLWNYNPMKFFNAQFLSDEKIILISVDIYGGAFYERSILKRVDKTKGDVIIFESKNGEVVYRDKIEVPFPVYEIKNIELIKGNIVKVDFGEDGKLLIALKENIIVNTKNIGCKSYWSNGWPIEMKSIVIRRDKDNKKELLFYRKLK